MKTMKTIEERNEELTRQESTLRKELGVSEKKVKNKAIGIGKIAVASGLTTLLLYWIYKSFFAVKKKKTRKKRKKSKQLYSRVGQFTTPFLVKLFNEVLDSGSESEKENQQVD